MKWGVRRYQNADGTLTAAGKKKARREYKADNKEAYELGKSATIYGHAAARSMKRTVKLENKLDKQYAKDPEGTKRRTKSLAKDWQTSAKTTAELTEQYMALKNKAETHCKSLIDKYGQEAISSIKFKDVKLPKGEHSPDSFSTMNEKTNNWTDYVRAAGDTLVSVSVSQMFALPVAVVFTPRTTYEKARDLELATYFRNRKSKKQQDDGSSTGQRNSSDKAEKESARKREDRKSGNVTNVEKALKSKTPYYALSDKERASVDRSYKDRRASLTKQWNNAKTPEQKQRILDQIDNLELDYLEIVERD